MFIEMTCSCTAAIQVELKEHQETMGLILVNRFSNAHVGCGFMTEVPAEESKPAKTFNLRITDKD